MKPLSPAAKKYLSACAVAVVLALLGVLNQFALHASPAVQTIAVSLVGAAVHYVNAWGHAQRVDDLVTAQVTAAIDSESAK